MMCQIHGMLGSAEGGKIGYSFPLIMLGTITLILSQVWNVCGISSSSSIHTISKRIFLVLQSLGSADRKEFQTPR